MLFLKYAKVLSLLCFSGLILNQSVSTLELYELKSLLQEELSAQKSEIINDLVTTIGNSKYSKPTTNLFDKNFNYKWNLEIEQNIPIGCIQKSDKNQIQLLRVNNSGISPFYAYCNYDLNTNWMLIQRRQDGSENFYRGWEDYKHGFGSLYGEFWLGLERIYEICKQYKQQLWIRLIDYNDEQTDAFYKYFSIAGEDEKYKLSVFEYSGGAGNQLAYNVDSMFSTYDSHNGNGKQNCAIQEIGAWWYDNCLGSNLNGPYRSNANKKTKPSISWTSGFKYESFRYVHMAIRPAESY